MYQGVDDLVPVTVIVAARNEALNLPKCLKSLEPARRVIVVDVPESIQLARTAARDQVPLEQIRAIMEAQATREDRLRQAHDVLTNDRDLAALHAQVDALHERYLAMLSGDSL